MNGPVISVIVPIYKAEQYLDRCVSSIRNQTYQNLEIILVDDGSPDRCGEMCDAYAKEDSRIRVFHKENGGQSSARNLGLDHMTGEYVGFVDSDDWIEPDMYMRLYELIVKYSAQIAICGIQCDYSDGRIVYFNDDYPDDKEIVSFSTIEALKELTFHKRITNSPCDKLFHKDIFADIRMSVGKVYEDFEMMPFCLEKASQVVYDSNPQYHYVMTNESTTRGEIKLKRFVEAEISACRVEYYKNKYPSLYEYALAGHIEICLDIISASAGSQFIQPRRALIEQMKKRSNRTAFHILNLKTKIKYVLFCLNVDLYSKLMNAYHNR